MLLPTIFFVAIALGQDADGYYISKKGDTVRGKILVSTFRGVKPGAQTRYSFDPLGNDVPDESREINFNDFQDEFKFSQDVGKRKKLIVEMSRVLALLTKIVSTIFLPGMLEAINRSL